MYTGTINLDKIRVTSAKYTTTQPSERKMNKRREEYKKNPRLFITIKEGTCELVEGYTYYLLAKELGLNKVECSYVNKDEKFIDDFTNKEGKELKKEIFKKANYRCYICNEKVVRGSEYSTNYINFGTIDHVTPRAKGGHSNVKNLRCCCRFCNKLKADNLLTNDLRDKIKEEKRLARLNNITTVENYSKEIIC